MSLLEIVFWFSALVAAYTYAGYGLVISALAALRPRPHSRGPIRPTVALIIAAHNEEAVIREKILNSLSQTYPRELLQVVVVSDGSTDNTPAIVQEYGHAGVVSLHQPARMGKAAAMERAVENTQSDILVFSDANSMYTADTIEKLVRNFADTQVGCVAGEKQICGQDGAGAVREAGLYWRYESYLKHMDSRVNSVVGAAGELFAIRRSLFRPAEPDSIIEDFVISMRVAANGHRVIYEPEAISMEDVPASVADEFERRVRISAGGFQSIVRLRGLLLSRRWLLLFQYVSHRVLRWALVPFLLPVLVLTNVALADRLLYQGLLVTQVALMGLAAGGWLCGILGWHSPRITRVPFYFYMLNIAALMGFYRYVSRRQKVTWTRTRRLASKKEDTLPGVLSPVLRRGGTDKR